jgi:hypothetical protein
MQIFVINCLQKYSFCPLETVLGHGEDGSILCVQQTTQSIVLAACAFYCVVETLSFVNGRECPRDFRIWPL